MSSSPNSSPSPPPVESLVAGRSKRSNAGNRLQVLLAAQEPLEDEDNIFLELEDDQEFDLEQEQEVEMNDEEEEEQEEEDKEDSHGGKHSDNERSPSRQKKSPKRKRLRPTDEHEEDEENFSSSSEESNESDQEDDNLAGEKELQRQEKEAQRKRKRQAELPFLKKPPAPKKKKVTISETPAIHQHQPLRHSNRGATVRNKEDVTQRLKESEARRAKIVPVAPKPKVHMTQEERLAETVITEKKNKQSLLEFFEQESDRKKRQRAAILARRPTLTYFIRFRSVLDQQPKLVQEIQDGTNVTKPMVVSEKGALSKTEAVNNNRNSESPDPGIRSAKLETTSGSTLPANSGAGISETVGEGSPAVDANRPTDETNNIKTTETTVDNASPLKGQIEEVGKDDQLQQETKNAEAIDIETKANGQEHTIESVKNHSDGDLIKAQPDNHDEVQPGEPVNHPIDDTRELETVARTLVSLEEFPPEAIQKPSSFKEILLGPNAVKPSASKPQPTLCLITGKPSRFRDPFSGIPYYGLREYKMIRALYNRTLAHTSDEDNGVGSGDWDVDVLHGAYYLSPEDLLGIQSGERLHARGVPEAFYR